jgi:hypothetical protein
LTLSVNGKSDFITCLPPEDTTPPTCIAEITPAGWTTGNVTATAYCSDTGSGAKVGCKNSVLFNTITKHDTSYRFEVVDNTGNKGTCISPKSKIDKVAPVI